MLKMKIVKITRDALKKRDFKAKNIKVVGNEEVIEAKVIIELLKKC